MHYRQFMLHTRHHVLYVGMIEKGLIGDIGVASAAHQYQYHRLNIVIRSSEESYQLTTGCWVAFKLISLTAATAVQLHTTSSALMVEGCFQNDRKFVVYV